MTVQLRETQFAWAVRLLSGNRLFQYPDEIDQDLAARFSPAQLPLQPEEHYEGDEDAAPEKVAHQPEEQVYLVDWYGLGDQEVRSPLCRTSLTIDRTHKTGLQPGSSSSQRRSAFSTSPSTSQARSMFQDKRRSCTNSTSARSSPHWDCLCSRWDMAPGQCFGLPCLRFQLSAAAQSTLARFYFSSSFNCRLASPQI
jgi:hypothetical protein